MLLSQHATGKLQPLLTEGSVFELLRRDRRVVFDPFIAHAALVYDDVARPIVEEVHRSYLAIGRRHGLPMVAFADTWRASGERIARSRFAGRDVNGDNVGMLRGVIGEGEAGALLVALTGPRGDAYRPSEAPTADEAIRYHAPQIAALADARPDAIMAATLPSFEEAKGIAAVMSESGLPWLLSFVVRPSGDLLDGTPLGRAIEEIDALPLRAAAGYSINCVHPSVASQALDRLTQRVAQRVIALQANTSRLSPDALDGREEIDGQEPEGFARELAEVAERFGIAIVGGCCGSDHSHMEALASLLAVREVTAPGADRAYDRHDPAGSDRRHESRSRR